MCIKWIEYQGERILYQDFAESSLFNSARATAELALVREMVLAQPLNSVRLLSDFRKTNIGKDLMDLMVENSRFVVPHIKKTAALGVTGSKRIMAKMVVQLSGQPITFFEDAETAQQWLVE